MSVPELDPQIRQVLADAEAAGLPPVAGVDARAGAGEPGGELREDVRPGRRGALGRGRGRRRRAGADLPPGRDRREEHGARLLPRRRLRGRQRRRLRPARARVREARGLRRDLGRLPARARASVPGGARRLPGRRRSGSPRTPRSWASTRGRSASAATAPAARSRPSARAAPATTASRIACQLLLYPITSSDQNTPSYSLYSQGYLLTRDAMHWYWKQYLGEAPTGSRTPTSHRPPSATCAACRARSSSPPRPTCCATRREAYAQRLFISAVETEGYRYDGMVHGFLRMAGAVERSNQAIDEISESLSRAREGLLATTRTLGASSARARSAAARRCLRFLPRFGGAPPLGFAGALRSRCCWRRCCAVRRLGQRALVARSRRGSRRRPLLGTREARDHLLRLPRVGVRAEALELAHHARELRVLLLHAPPGSSSEEPAHEADLRASAITGLHVLPAAEAAEEEQHSISTARDREEDDQRDQQVDRHGGRS